MKKSLIIACLCALLANCAPAMASDFKFAVVDLNKVIVSAAQVKALKAEHDAQVGELKTWLKTVKDDVNKQQTKEGKEKLIKKYDAEFAKKQEALKKNHAAKLNDFEKNLLTIIEKEAKEKGYNMVVPKTSILYGGDDITSSIIKLVK